MDRESILRGLSFVLPKAPNISGSVIQELAVHCVAPSTLLSRVARIPAQALDAVFVDAEGLDATLLLSLFALRDVHPALIIFEAHIARDDYQRDFRRLLLTLADRDYRLDCCKCLKVPPSPWNCSRSGRYNGIAWDPKRVSIALPPANGMHDGDPRRIEGTWAAPTDSDGLVRSGVP